MTLNYFTENNKTLFEKTNHFFQNNLQVALNLSNNQLPFIPKNVLKERFKENKNHHQNMNDIFHIGFVSELAFKNDKDKIDFENIKDNYKDGILIFAVDFKNNFVPNRTEMAEITRDFNVLFNQFPCFVLFHYQNLISLATNIRENFKRKTELGEKIGKVVIIKDIDTQNTHRGHINILQDLQAIESGESLFIKKITTFEQLYKKWLDVFNLSLLNNRFYKEIANWYFWAVENTKFPIAEKDKNQEQTNQIAIIRLLTRLIFVWFIKEKNLVNENLFDDTFINKIIKDFGKNNYYKAILQNLFFATLNRPINERQFAEDKGYNPEDYGLNNLYRYEKLFQNEEPKKIMQIFEQIPFLNGGLFDSLDKKENKQYFDGFTRNEKFQPNVPDYLFFGKEDANFSDDLKKIYEIKDKKNKIMVTGIFNIFQKYKFTIEENTSIEQDIALDPELLGQVFENLLAYYNPETASTARKGTGSFYTPREIVDYMVDESIVGYLLAKIPKQKNKSYIVWGTEQIDMYGNDVRNGQLKLETPLAHYSTENLEKDLRILLDYQQNTNPFQDKPQEIKAIIRNIYDLKILDPACGSGAFPMGILNKLVMVLNKLDKKNQYIKNILKSQKTEEVAKTLQNLAQEYNIKKQNIEKNKEIANTFTFDDLKEKNIKELNLKLEQLQQDFENQKNDIENNFKESNFEWDYAKKLYLIQNCIYGVDIQNIAIQISKLRFFLSLVIEQKNNHIQPLPNLETKFVCANTLIALDKPKGQTQIKNLLIEPLEKELEEVRHKHFNVKNKNAKYKITKDDKRIRTEIATLLEKDGWNKKSAEQIAQFDIFDQNAKALWFDAEWMFGIKDGFDIVIGNPPYVQIQKLKDKQTEFESQKFETYSKSSDLYCLFYEKGNQLLKENGLLCMITSNKWMRAKYGETMRKFFVENTNPLLLVDFGNLQVFETATVDTNILITQKTKKTNQTKAVKFDKNYDKTQGLQKYINENAYILTALNENAWVIGEKDGFDVKSKVEKQGIPIKDWKIKINRGVVTGLNEAFIIDEKTKNELNAKNTKNAEIIKPILRGRDISKWYPDFENTWLIGTFPSLKLNIEDYPSILKYLLDFGKDKLIQDGTGRKKTGNQWFETQDQIAYYKDFEKPKIIYPNMTKYMPFVYDEEGFYTNQKCFIITGEHLKYLTCFFNSALFKYCFSDNFPELQGGTRELSKVYFDKIPVKPVEAEYENLFNHLVDYLVFLKKRIQNSKAIGKNYDKELLMQMLFDEISDGLIMEMYLSDEFEKYNVHLKKRLLDMPNIDLKDEEKSFKKLLAYYEIISHYTHQIQGSLSVIVTIPVIRLIYHTVRS